MEVRAGYKQTEVGVIPSDWNVEPLVEVATIATGNTPPTSDSANYGDEYLFVSPADLGEHKYILDTGKKLSKKGFEISRKFPKNSILFTCIGSTIGKCGVAPIELTSNQQINAIFPDKSFSGEYLYYELSFLSPRIKSLAGEQAVPLINKTQFGESPVALPPLPEQRAIATALSDVDALLAAQDKLIAKKRDIKQAAMQQLLTGKQRLPGFSGEWEVKRLGDVVEIRKGQLITEKDAVAGDIPVIAGGKKPAYFHNKPNRLGKTITVSASGASAGYVAFFDTPIFASDCSTISEGATYSIEFMYYQLVLNQEVIYKSQTGGAQPHIHAVDLMPLEVGSPNMAEQTAIAAVLSDMDAEIAMLEKKRDKTRSLKQGMMQALLTGRIRLV